MSLRLSTTNGFIVGQANAVTNQMEAAYILLYNRALPEAEVEQNRRALKSIFAGRRMTLPW